MENAEDRKRAQFFSAAFRVFSGYKGMI